MLDLIGFCITKEIIPSAAQEAMPKIRDYVLLEICPAIIKNKIKEKRRQAVETGKMIKELSLKGILLSYYVKYLNNSILRTCSFPSQLKKAPHVILIPKSRRDPSEVNSYRPITVCYRFYQRYLKKKPFTNRLRRILLKKNIIYTADHHFGFRKQHATIEIQHGNYKQIIFYIYLIGCVLQLHRFF